MSDWKRLLITAEGRSELRFVKDVLSHHLIPFGIGAEVSLVKTGKDRNREYSGGVVSYAKCENHIKRWIKQNDSPDVFFTTIFDLYGLPSDFPGYNKAKACADPYQKVEVLEKALSEEIKHERFIPYFMLHEFESLIFADLDKLNDHYLGMGRELKSLQKQLEQAKGNPELINDSPETAPSKRIQALIPGYKKAQDGAIILKDSDIHLLRKHCRHFNQWIDQLEKI